MTESIQSENFPELGDISAKAKSLTDEAYDPSSGTVYFPVRHHSPACSLQLTRLFDIYEPDCVLIEGPSDANDLIDILVRSKAPVAVYCSFSDKSGGVSEEKEDHKCYYPFLDCSPELIALRTTAERGTHSEFIDLEYPEILKSQADGSGLRRDDASYCDEYLLAHSRFISEMCERLGMRDHFELWEKYFEIQYVGSDVRDYIEAMLTYCLIAREDTPPEQLRAEGIIAREARMAYHITEARKKYERVLVVTGGFHTCALPTLVKNGQAPKPDSKAAKGQLYPVAYSYEAADALSGYASGMPSPGFYNKVWNKLSSGEDPVGAYRGAILDILAAAGRKLRSRGETISAYDETCAYDMCLGLARLRAKHAPGLYELRDSVLSCFVKGEHNISTDLPMRVLSELTTGSGVGVLCEGAAVPPILTDFAAQSKRLGLKNVTSVGKEVTLDIFSSAKHRETARFFHRTSFLDVEYAKRIRGVDLRTGEGRNLVREVWKYRLAANTQAQLIDCSVYGSTVEEACERVFARRLSEAAGAAGCASLLVSAFEMGLDKVKEAASDSIDAVIVSDGGFSSLASALRLLTGLRQRAELYRITNPERLEGHISVIAQWLITLLPSVANVSENDRKETADACAMLYRLSDSGALSHLRGQLIEAFISLSKARPIDPYIEGVVHGLLYGSDAGWRETAVRTSEGYFRATGAEVKKAVDYLGGLFFTARDLVLIDQSFVRSVDALLSEADDAQFMSMLPGLRLAFAAFTPYETDRIAAKAAALHGAQGRDITRREAVSPELYSYAKTLDTMAVSKLEEYGKEMSYNG